MNNPLGLGGFQKGTSGNISGRSKRDFELGELARTHTKAALATLVDIMRNSKKDADRLHAAIALLDRGYGRPAQCLNEKGVNVIQPVIISNVFEKSGA